MSDWRTVLKVSKREEENSLMLSDDIRGLHRSAPLILTASVGGVDIAKNNRDTISNSSIEYC